MAGPLEFTLPNNEHPPSKPAKIGTMLHVSFLVPLQLWPPVFLTGLWETAFPTGGVLMPEASMHKDNFPQTHQHNVGASWKVFAMQTEPEAHAVNH